LRSRQDISHAFVHRHLKHIIFQVSLFMCEVYLYVLVSKSAHAGCIAALYLHIEHLRHQLLSAQVMDVFIQNLYENPTESKCNETPTTVT
jgi:hypothetical protein